MNDVKQMKGLSIKSANALVQEFIKEKILVESTGYQRNRTFIFEKYVKMF